MEITLGNIARHISERYKRAKNNKNSRKLSDIYNAICQETFNWYGQALGYENVDTFKSDVAKLRHDLKRKRERASQIPPPSGNMVKRNLTCTPEGSGLLFTLEQIRYLNLNEDSYL